MQDNLFLMLLTFTLGGIVSIKIHFKTPLGLAINMSLQWAYIGFLLWFTSTLSNQFVYLSLVNTTLAIVSTTIKSRHIECS